MKTATRRVLEYLFVGWVLLVCVAYFHQFLPLAERALPFLARIP